MNRLKLLSMTGILTLSLASTTLAGNIHTGVVSPPPPPPENSLIAEPETSTAPDKIQTGFMPSGLGTEIILNLLQVLSVY